MKQNSNKGKNLRKSAYYAGVGLVIGAGVGMIFGLLLNQDQALSSAFGAAMGLLIGAAIDLQRQYKNDSNE
ncbi:MAG: hypothetical protein U9R58_04205 [Chloroflexota bacterium]|nr:hypothetical protein [Chloroflexota bacterium]